MSELQVGQELWFVPRHSRNAERSVTVEKVGRKWAHVSGGCRVSIETLIVDGGDGSSLGQCYLSRAEYEARIALVKEWDSFRRQITGKYVVPELASIETIVQARAILGLSESKE